MFDDLDELSDADLLAAAAEYAQDQERAAVGVLRTALAFADRNAVIPGHKPLPGCERFVVYGGDGCPEIAEFAPVEFGAVLGMSSGAAASLIGEALALRHRLPRVWAAVLSGHAVSWRARKVAEACLSLSLEAAGIVDRRVAGIVNTVTPGRLRSIVTAAVWEADPDQAQANAEAAARTRGVFVAQSDEHGTKRIWVRAAAGDVIRFDATIDDLARALAALGDTDTLDQRRAKAIGWIADPAAAHQLLEVARHLARTHTTRNHTARTSSPADPPFPAPTAPTGHTREPGDPADIAADPVDVAAAADSATTRGDAAQANADDTVSMSDVYDADLGDGGDLGDLGDRGDGVAGEDAFTRQALAGTLPARLAAIKRDAYTKGLGAGLGSGARSRRNRHTLYVHLTDKTLATGNGVLRVEELGPLLARQLSELLGHDQVIIKPVIDLHDQVSVHSYEIPDRIRERVRLRHPVDMFPYGGAEATVSMDQDHIRPYDHTDVEPSGRAGSPDRTRPSEPSGRPGQTGPPTRAGQTSTDNLIPQSRLHHRAKTFGGWRNRRLPTGAIEWISPHGYHFIVDHTGTHPTQSPKNRRPQTTTTP